MSEKISKIRSLCKKNDREDDRVLVKSSFRWLYVVIWILFAFVFLFTNVFRVVSFAIQTDSGIKTVGVIVSSEQPRTGDSVVAVIAQKNAFREVIACSGDEISVGIGKSGLTDCIVYKNQRYFSADELGEVLKDLKVPKNCVLLKDSITENGNFRVGEIVEIKKIIGKADCIVYPFDMLGLSVDKIQN